MGKLEKKTFVDYVQFECERKLLWDLGRENKLWIQDNRISPIRRENPRKADTLMRMGKKYEIDLYRALHSCLRETSFLNSWNNVSEEFGEYFVEPSNFRSLAEKIINDGQKYQRLILECSFEFPLSFFKTILLQEEDESPKTEYSTNVRPDVILLDFNPTPRNNIIEITVKGLSEVIPTDLAKKIGLRLFDIKLCQQDNVGKRHFIEILFYAYVLAYYLKENNIDDLFYVSIAGNGIIPYFQHQHLAFSSLDAFLDNFMVPVEWEDIFPLYDHCIEAIQGIVQTIPMPVTDTKTNIQANCDRCNYIDDCKSRHRYYYFEKEQRIINPNLGSVEIELIPHLTQDQVSQLKAEGWNRVYEVDQNIPNLPEPEIPSDLYSKKTSLSIKSRSLNRGSIWHATGIKSLKIPPSSDMSLVFSIEVDPIHQRVYAASLDFLIRPLDDRSYNDDFLIILQLINEYIENPDFDVDDVAESVQDINPDIDDTIIEGLINSVDHLIEVVNGRMIRLQNTFEFKCTYYYISNSILDSAELALAEDFLMTFYHVINLAVFIERSIGEFNNSPNLTVYYWSREVVEAIQEMLSRQMVELSNTM